MLPSVDEAILIKIIVHPDRCLNVYRCGERVDVTIFSTRGGCNNLALAFATLWRGISSEIPVVSAPSKVRQTVKLLSC